LPEDCANANGTYGGAQTVCAMDDCDSNGVDDFCDVLGGADDCNGNLIPDVCELAGNDCNANGVLDECDIAAGTSEDCNDNLIPDECEVPPLGTGPDCNSNGIPDECEDDCNTNGIPDDCDVMSGASEDCNGNMIPDECELGRSVGRAGPVIHTTARGQNNPGGHLVTIYDETGTKTGQYDQIAGAQSSSWGYRDGAYDGDYLYFGWESGVARHDVDGANGAVFINSAPPDAGVTAWRALTFDPTNNFGAPGLWTASWASPLIKVDMAGNLLVSHANGGYSLYGLAYDMGSDMLWGFGMPGDVNDIVEIDPATGAMTGVQFSADYTGTAGTQGGIEYCGGLLYGLSQETDTIDVIFSCDLTGALAGPITPNPRQLDPQTGENGNLGIAVVCGAAGGDCNTNGIPDECDIPIALGGFCDPLVSTCSLDCNTNMVPDECELGDNDCNGNGIPDDCDIAAGTSLDCQPDGIPDECQLYHNDCNGNDIPDECDIASGTSEDCNNNGLPDECDVASGASPDCQGDGIPDECQLHGADRAVILTEDFEAAVPPATWTAIATHSGEETWFQSDSAYAGTYSAQCDYDADLVAQDEWMLTPPMLLFGDVTVSGATMGSVYWGVTPYDNYDVEVWAVVGPAPDPVNDVLIGTLDADFWVSNFTWETFSYTFAAPTGQFRLGFRYVGNDGAQGNVDEILVDGETGAPANDCNVNGVPDECDVPPICTDPWPACSLDSNNNGTPDECEIACLGDSNCDGGISWRDIDFFVAAMNDNAAAWEAMFTGDPACTFYNNDVNEDGTVNWRDIDPFVALMNTVCP
jgi:hypothetical protein